VTASKNVHVLQETPPGTLKAELHLALKGYEKWFKRITESGELVAKFFDIASKAPFYRCYFEQTKLPLTSIEDFPVVDRAQHLGERDLFLTPDFAADAKRYFAYTNGTFSPSLKVSFDIAALFDLNYATYLRFLDCIPTLLDATRSGEPSVFMLSDTPHDRQTSIIMPSLNACILRKFVMRRTEDADRAIARYLRRSKIGLLHVKPSVLLHLETIDADLKGEGRIRPHVIFTSGENLYPDHRARFENWFECPVIDAYVTTEGGVIGLECQHKKGHHILTDRVIVELLLDGGGIGRTGSGELLITNLVNWAHIFARYRVGDRVSIKEGSCLCGYVGPTIVQLSGRDRTHYREGAGTIDTNVLVGAIRHPAVKDYQVTARGQRLIVTWVPNSHDVRGDIVSRDLTNAIHRIAPDLKFGLKIANTVSRPGGKLRRFL
jgi:hypothetical protein